MSSKDRRQREKQLLRQEILDAARSLFVKEGYENVSMRKVAQKIDYSPTTIYLYFKDKSDLLYSVCEESFARLMQEFQAIEKQTADPVRKLERGLCAYVQFGLRHPQHYLLAFVLPHEHGHEPERYVQPESMGMRAFAYLRRLIGQCVKQKKFRRVDVETASQALWAAVHGITSLLIVHPEFPWVRREALIGQVIDAMVRDLQA